MSSYENLDFARDDVMEESGESPKTPLRWRAET